MAGENGGDGGKETPTIESLSAQIENLNQGIAKYRDEAGTAKKDAEAARAEAKTAKEAADAAKKAIEEAQDPDEKELKLSPDDQKKLDSWAKAQGYVTKEDMEKERVRLQTDTIKTVEAQAINEFLEKHPELNNDDEWKKIADQFGMYRQPTNITGYRQVLSKIYKDLFGNDEAAARVRAQDETRKRLALGGGNQKEGDEKAQIDAYQEKYPHLSREQIESRIKEINDLAQERAKKKASKNK